MKAKITKKKGRVVGRGKLTPKKPQRKPRRRYYA